MSEAIWLHLPKKTFRKSTVAVSEIALFPLGRAIVPGGILKLQLFEQRYLSLVKSCMASAEGFGIVGLRSGGEAQADSEFYSAGCLVQIEDWDQLQNGLLGIEVRADRRFLIQSSWQKEDGLWQAQVKWLQDDWLKSQSQSGFAIGSDYQGLLELYQTLASHTGESVDPAKDATSLGWAIASLLPIDNSDFEQLLLENDPLERLGLLAAKIDQLSLR